MVEYAEYLRMGELTEGTIHIYLREAQRFEKYLSQREITKARMVEYKKILLQEGNKPTTVNLHIVAVNRYLRYLGYADCMLKSLRIQARQSLDNQLSKEEYLELLAYAKESGNEKYYLILRTLAMTGIRISELKFFTVEALGQKVILVTGKQKTREICVPERLIRELQVYCAGNGIKRGTIFRGSENKPLSRIAVYKMLVKMADIRKKSTPI